MFAFLTVAKCTFSPCTKMGNGQSMPPREQRKSSPRRPLAPILRRDGEEEGLVSSRQHRKAAAREAEAAAAEAAAEVAAEEAADVVAAAEEVVEAAEAVADAEAAAADAEEA